MRVKEVDELLKRLDFLLRFYPTMSACHWNMTQIDREISKTVMMLKTRGADTPDEY